MKEHVSGKTTKVMYCACNNDFQNSRYGAGRRVHNLTKQNSSKETRNWRCTVCGDEKIG